MCTERMDCIVPTGTNACETYSRILELNATPAARTALLIEIGAMPPTEQVDKQLYLAALRAAVAGPAPRIALPWRSPYHPILSHQTAAEI